MLTDLSNCKGLLVKILIKYADFTCFSAVGHHNLRFTSECFFTEFFVFCFWYTGPELLPVQGQCINVRTSATFGHVNLCQDFTGNDASYQFDGCRLSALLPPHRKLCFYCRSFVCLQDSAKTTQLVLLKLGGRVGVWAKNGAITFWQDSDKGEDPGKNEACLREWYLWGNWIQADSWALVEVSECYIISNEITITWQL